MHYQSSCHWKKMIIDDEQFFIRLRDHDGGWKIFITDMRDIWFEKLGRSEILRKCVTLNPTLSIEDIDVVRFVGDLFNDIGKNAVKKSIERIEFAKDLDGGIFKFSIDLTRGNSALLWEEVTMPLCSVAMELQRRQAVLLKLVKSKDEEIAEYIFNGAELIRKHIKTVPFTMDVLKNNPSECNNGHTSNTIEELMTLCSDDQFLDKTESILTCLPKKKIDPEKLTTISESVRPEIHTDVIPTVKKESEEISLAERNDPQESCTFLPKNEATSLSKLASKTDNADTSNDKKTRPKQRLNASCSRENRKRTIHDIIT